MIYDIKDIPEHLREYFEEAPQIGLEDTPALYVAKMVQVFEEVRRVLKPDGTLWLNLGDSYANDGKWGGNTGGKHASGVHGSNGNGRGKRSTGLKPKDLIGIPWRVAFALQEAGWWLRQDIIWSKPNPMPESVTDRCTKAHEYIFLLTKNAHYYYDNDAVKERAAYDGRKDTMHKSSPKYATAIVPNGTPHTFAAAGHERWQMNGDGEYIRNKRSVWTVATKPYSEAHFATFPPKLIEPCILAGSREGDTVLDPFNGSGTTGLVSLQHRRNYIGIELNPAYIEIAEKRLREVQVELFV